MSTKITSNGHDVKLEYNGVTERVSTNGNYSTNTQSVAKSNAETVQVTANQRNVDIKGNS